MIQHPRWLAAGLFTTLALITTTPVHAAPRVENSSTYVGGGRWDWSIFIVADAETLRRIECVEHTLHPTFPDPVRTVCTRASRFHLTARGWGTFTINIKVLYKDGAMQPISHPLQFH